MIFIVAKLSSPVQLCGEDKWFMVINRPAKETSNKERFTTFARMSSFTSLSDEYIGDCLCGQKGQNPDSIESMKLSRKNDRRNFCWQQCR